MIFYAYSVGSACTGRRAILAAALVGLSGLLAGFFGHLAVNPAQQRRVDDFHKLYYGDHKKTWLNTTWLGTTVQKCPLDLWVYQEIIYETRPDIIIEAGTLAGGSALFFASMFDLLGQGRVATIDVKKFGERPQHPRITYLRGSSTSNDIVERVKSITNDGDRVMVVLDSDHSRDHVLNELRLYSPMVSEGCYLIVEDTNINGHPVLTSFGPGPMEATEAFLAENDDFEIDREREKFLLTFNLRGYLRKKKLDRSAFLLEASEPPESDRQSHLRPR